MTGIVYNSRRSDALALHNDQVLYNPQPGAFELNERLVKNIRGDCLNHVLWITDDLLDIFSQRYKANIPISGIWGDIGDDIYGKCVTWSWVEKDDKKDNSYGGVKLEIEGRKNNRFVWMIDHKNPDKNYDKEFNMWKAVWPD